MSNTRNVNLVAYFVLLLVGCGGLERNEETAPTSEGLPTMKEESPPKETAHARGRAERWMLTDSEYAGSILVIESPPPTEQLSEVVFVQCGLVELLQEGELLLRFDFDRLLTEHAMGTRFDTYRDSLSGQQVTIAKRIESEEPYQLHIATRSLDEVAGLTVVSRAD